jgi:hypothetical protein
MKKTLIVIALLLAPALLITLGFYFKEEILSSVGYVILIFYIIMAIRGKFRTGEKNR